MKKIIIILTIFFLDRIVKIYLINLETNGIEVDIYVNSYLNFYLVWNTGIGFGLASMESNIYYHIVHILSGIIFSLQHSCLSFGLLYYSLNLRCVFMIRCLYNAK